METFNSLTSLADRECGQLGARRRAMNYLAAGQLFLTGNPLLRTELLPRARQAAAARALGELHGIENIATASTGYLAAGRGLNRYRKRQLALRAKLQKKRTKSAKRRLRARARKEAAGSS